MLLTTSCVQDHEAITGQLERQQQQQELIFPLSRQLFLM